MLGPDEKRALHEYLYDETDDLLVLSSDIGTAIINKRMMLSTQLAVASFICDERGDDVAMLAAKGRVGGICTLEKYRKICARRIPSTLRAELDNVAIRIDHQGKGFGKVFVKFLVKEILDKGVGDPFLYCLAVNQKARRLYDSLGFEEVFCNVFAVKTVI